MEVKLGMELNAAIEELQTKIKKVTGRHKSKRYLLQQLVDVGIEKYNTGDDALIFAETFDVNPGGVVVSIVFGAQATDEIGRIHSVEDMECGVYTKNSIINALARIGMGPYSEPYDQIIKRESLNEKFSELEKVGNE